MDDKAAINHAAIGLSPVKRWGHWGRKKLWQPDVVLDPFVLLDCRVNQHILHTYDNVGVVSSIYGINHRVSGIVFRVGFSASRPASVIPRFLDQSQQLDPRDVRVRE